MKEIVLQYTVRLRRADASAWEVFPAYSASLLSSVSFVSEQMKSPAYDMAQIVNGQEVWEMKKVTSNG